MGIDREAPLEDRAGEAQRLLVLGSLQISLVIEDAESLCESVCLISKAKKVLDGNLSELKKRERRGIVELDFEGDDGWIRGPEVEAAERTGKTMRVRVREGGDPQALLRRGVQAGADIHRFELVEPKLHEIFVRYAGEEAAGDAGLPQDFNRAGGVA